ncbi:MAG: hypothetical protein LBL62_00330, partial [Planctomycetaceae bacterium]|nr:hypothetical protein [Planctomycetaceae bacterium]
REQNLLAQEFIVSKSPPDNLLFFLAEPSSQRSRFRRLGWHVLRFGVPSALSFLGIGIYNIMDFCYI